MTNFSCSLKVNWAKKLALAVDPSLLLLGFGAWGRTTFAVTSGAAQHAFTVRGRDAKLFDFGEMVGEVLRRVAR